MSVQVEDFLSSNRSMPHLATAGDHADADMTLDMVEGDPTLDFAPSSSDDTLNDPVASAFPPATASLKAPRAASPQPAAALYIAPGLKLKERYLLQQVIGSGGTSMVYRAQDMQPSEDGSMRVLAVKLLREELRDDARAIERLKREYTQMQLLAHPNILKVFDLESEQGTWFMTMELLEGQSLSMYLRSHRDPHPQSMEIIKACAEALAFAHERGVLHADFKPGNLFLTRDGVRILDFIGAGEEPRASDRAATPAYASPQRLAGEAPTPSDDVFSLGCVAYELLTGVHPFQRKPSSVARELGMEPQRIGSLTYRQWRALDRALAFDPLDRHTTMHVFIESMFSDSVTPPRRAAARDITKIAAPATVLPFVPAAAGRDTAAVATLPPPVDNTLRMREDEVLLQPDPELARPNDRVLPPLFEPPRSRVGLPIAIALLLGLLSIYVARDDAGNVVDTKSASSSLRAATQPLSTAANAAVPRLPSLKNDEPVIQPSAPPPTPATTTSVDAAEQVATDKAMSASAETTPADRPAVVRVANSAATSRAPVAPRAAPHRIGFQTSRISVTEKAVAAVIQVRRLGGPGGRLPIKWRTDRRSAQPGQDYEGVPSGTFTLQAGQNVGAIYVPLINDDISESDETFIVELVSTPVAEVTGIGMAIVTIRDDDRVLLTHNPTE